MEGSPGRASCCRGASGGDARRRVLDPKMDDVLPVMIALGSVLAGGGGVVAALYYGDRWLERRRERRPVSAELISVGEAACVRSNEIMFHVRARLHNPKVVPCRVTEVCLRHKMVGYVLKPVGRAAYGYYWFTGDTPIELPAKRPSELDLGFPFKREAVHGEDTELEEFCLDIALDDGSHVRSQPFLWSVDLRKAR